MARIGLIVELLDFVVADTLLAWGPWTLVAESYVAMKLRLSPNFRACQVRESWNFDPSHEEFERARSIFYSKGKSYRSVCRNIYGLCEWGRGRLELFAFNRWRTLPFSCWVACGIIRKSVKAFVVLYV